MEGLQSQITSPVFIKVFFFFSLELAELSWPSWKGPGSKKQKEVLGA